MAIGLVIGRDENERKKMSSYIQEWMDSLLAQDPQLDLRLYPNLGDINEIDFIVVLNAPTGIFKEFTHVKAILTLTAGVDSLLSDNSLLPHIPIVRIEDPFMADDICQYALTYVLQYMKQVEHWHNLQKHHDWDRRVPFVFSSKTIGVMGLGYLGKRVAVTLSQLGFTVNGWSQSPKEIPGVTVYTGQDQFIDFLQHTDIAVCLLPLTLNTRDILNKNTFSHLKKGAHIINMGRGEQLVEEDLLAALDSGQLTGATLDVFRQEPLPKDHLFWDHPKIIVTPHIASITNPRTAAVQVVENIKRMQKSEEPIGKVDLTQGY
jgi:glyoxylate/hydroxypyruvate reductase A